LIIGTCDVDGIRKKEQQEGGNKEEGIGKKELSVYL
jgi:hypothetical protein